MEQYKHLEGAFAMATGNHVESGQGCSPVDLQLCWKRIKNGCPSTRRIEAGGSCEGECSKMVVDRLFGFRARTRRAVILPGAVRTPEAFVMQ